ncbi:restriction endonuclease subunit S [[Ruminococcus] lactaris ATCC 29176]|uniref:restriction endonuclease subunit S n=3 Tax=[Ruminococcus] lactaris TaxID=46228 RepID=UPI0021A901B7|nr:restriction endonuclease subunit S [[Ruminococcus] lactaris]UWP65324.1 restriction endonuclease subunit S [[Ruminococcus] lactaris ATCC 29176]
MKKPKIRFKGYQEDWEQRKLVDLVDRVTRKNQDLVSELPLTISAQYGLIDQNEFFDKRVASKDVSGYYLIENGEFAYNKSTSTDAPWGAIKRLDRYKNGVLSTLYIVFGIKENNPVDSDFLVSYYSTNLWHKGIHEIAAEGARNHGLLNIAPADFFETKLMIPQDIEEQKKIGKYFEELERLITLHQRKCEETKTLKKYMLQKMFPQNGHSVPEIRFSGFTEDWEQRKFADFTWDAGKRNKEDLDLEPYAITNEHGFIRQRDAHDDFGYMKDTDRKAYNIVQPNSFAYNPARINVGSIGYYKGVENVIVSSLYEVFQTDNYVNDRFLWHWLKSDEFPRWIEKLQEGSVRLYFYYDKLCECQLYMPSLEEQEKIATFLDDLDHLITLHQHKCEELQNIKKFMLKNMFI